ncbi:methyltransferase [Candidatus Woesearchaeota archaeon]|jgi:uncharacterized protein|nr:methyltransferase [Candidatus Woesearchaeota archaeon]
MHPIITKKEADMIRITLGESVEISLDLGKTKTKVTIKDEHAHILGEKIPISAFSKVKPETCYLVMEGELKKLALFSDETNFYYKLVPSRDWPTVTLSSTPMHRHCSVTPKNDTISKMNEIEPIKGNILDTCCGLGYTAIMEAKQADSVNVFERDENVLEIAKLNPYSQELFTNPKIKLHIDSVFDGIKEFKKDFFDIIVHDPPTFKYSAELYSRQFYSELFRVLKKGGILYHYAPWPKKTHKVEFYRGIILKLEENGFSDVKYSEKSSGVVARKE